MNTNGRHSEFTYLERAGAAYQRTAYLTEAKVVIQLGAIQATNDSKWKVREPSGRVSHVDFDWLTYLGTNGTVYRAKVHCEGSHGLSLKEYTLGLKRYQKMEGNAKIK